MSASSTAPARPRRGRTPAPAAPSVVVRRGRRPLVAVLVPMLLVLVALGAVAISLGSVRMPLPEVWGILVHEVIGLVEPTWEPVRRTILLESRLPRVLLTIVVGASLAVAGAVAQAVTRNPLADPYLLGVSSGAGFGVVTVTVLGVGVGTAGAFTLPLAAFLGGLVPLLLVLTVIGRGGSSTLLILAGVAIGQIFQALITFMLLVVAEVQQTSQVLHWMAGGFGGARWSFLPVPTLALLVVGGLAIVGGRWLNLLHVGEEGAGAMGMNVRRFRLSMLVAVSLLAGAAVAFAGAIGFIGLVVPHAAVFLVGADARRSLPVAAVLGGIALLCADLVARSITPAGELPVGVVTALAGAPVFVVMLYRRRRSLA